LIEVNTALEKFDNNLWGFHLPLPINILDQLGTENRRVMFRILPSITLFNAGIMYSKAYPFLLLNTNNVKALRLTIGKKVTIEVESDLSDFGMDMPVELQELFNQDVSAKAYFDELTKGKQRSLIYIVSKVKNTHSRLNKALAIADHLNTSNGKLDFKQLNERIKYYNNL